MKKRFLLAILIIVCAACCAFGLSACDFILDVIQIGTDESYVEIIGGTNNPDGEGNTNENTDGSSESSGNGSQSGDGNQTDYNGGEESEGSKESEGNGGSDGHSHSYKTTYVAATCTKAGYVLYECSCGYSYTVEDEDSPALGHNLKYYDGTQATCTEAGYEDYSACTRCDYTTYKVIEPLGHDLTEHSAQEATCAHVGWEAYEDCSRCDYSTYTEIPVREHEAFEWVASGSYCVSVCVQCGYEREVTHHDYSDNGCTRCGLTQSAYLSLFNGTYGYNYFAEMQNGEQMQKLYLDIDYEVRAFHENGESAEKTSDRYGFAKVNYADYGLSHDEALSVWKTYRDDNPLYYWFSNSLVYSNAELILCVDEAYVDGTARTEQNEKVYSAVKEWTEAVSVNSSAYELTRTFHDAIIKAIDYAYDEAGYAQSELWAHSIVGVFGKEGAVCEGYAKAFQLLLNYCGVENVLVTGSGNGEAHAWNLVKLDDDKWYWYDVTWDDTPNSLLGISYTYFAATDKDFLNSHTPATPAGTGVNFLYGLPERSTAKYSNIYN